MNLEYILTRWFSMAPDLVSRRVMFLRLAVLLLLLWFGIRLQTFLDLNDSMAISGFLTVIAGLWISSYIEERFRRMLKTLLRENVLESDGDSLKGFLSKIERRSTRFQTGGATIIGVSLTLGYFFFYGDVELDWLIYEFSVASVVCALLVGGRLGLMVSYGQIANDVKEFHLATMIPSHPDGAGGTKVIGDFLMFQGLLTSTIMVWLGTWLVVLGADPPPQYARWLYPFWGLFCVASGFFWFAVVRPVTRFRVVLKQIKKRIAARFDDAFTREMSASARSRDTDTLGDFIRANQRLIELTDMRRKNRGASGTSAQSGRDGPVYSHASMAAVVIGN